MFGLGVDTTDEYLFHVCKENHDITHPTLRVHSQEVEALEILFDSYNL
jgi:hypothetical protein